MGGLCGEIRVGWIPRIGGCKIGACVFSEEARKCADDVGARKRAGDAGAGRGEIAARGVVGDMGEGEKLWTVTSFFLKILPKSFFAPVGVEGVSGMGGMEGATEVSPVEDKERTEESGVCGTSSGTRRLDRRADMEFMLDFLRSSSEPIHTSMGSRTARPITSMPRLLNLVTLASVPASTMVFVMTLCAQRL